MFFILAFFAARLHGSFYGRSLIIQCPSIEQGHVNACLCPWSLIRLQQLNLIELDSVLRSLGFILHRQFIYHWASFNCTLQIDSASFIYKYLFYFTFLCSFCVSRGR